MRIAVTALLVLAGGAGGLAVAQPAPPRPDPAGRHRGLVRVTTETPDERAAWQPRLAAMVRSGALKVREQRDTAAGRDQWLVQLHKGVPVHGTEVWRRLQGETLVAADGFIYEGIGVNPVPAITRAEARDLAAALVPGSLGPSRPPELVVLPTADGRYVLAYRAPVFDGVDLVVHFLEASTGAVVFSEKAPPPPAAGR